MIGSPLGGRVLGKAIATAVGLVLVVGGFLWVLSIAPIHLTFLDARIAAAIHDLAPDLTATVERTELVRAGRGVAIRVSGLRLARADGTTVLALPALTVRPSLNALLHGRIVIARVGIDDGDLALTRTAEDAWLLGSGDGGAGVNLGDVLHAAPSSSDATATALPLFELARAHVRIDDRRAAATLEIAGGDLVVRPRPDGIDVSASGGFRLVSTGPPVRGTLELPIRATAAIARAADGTLGTMELTLVGASGALMLTDDGGPPFALAGLDVTGVYLPAVETLRLQRVQATVGPSRVDARMTLILRDGPTLALDGTVDQLPLSSLTRFWPPEKATSVRTWLAEHTREGTLRACRVQLGLHGATAAPDAKPDAWDIACAFDGVTAHYLPPMAPIRAAVGAARLTPERLDVTVKRGEVGACRVEGGTLGMNLAVDPPAAAIAADVTGAGADVLAIIESPPLRLVSPLGITPKDLGGESRVHAELTLPIKHGVVADEVGVEATAKLTGASLPPLVGGIGIADGILDVTTDGATFAVSGTTIVTGLPELTAPARLDVTVAPKPDTKGTGERVVTLSLDGDGAAVHGSALLVQNAVASVTVDRLQLGGHDLAGTVRRSASGGYDASVTGDSLDLAALLDDPRFKSGEGAANATSYDVTVRLGRVRAAAGTEIRDVTGSLQGAGGTIAALAVTGTLGDGTFQATLEGPPSARKISVTSSQAGAVLKAAGIPTEFAGGSLQLTATTDERGPREHLDGELLLHDIRVVKAPVLARVLSLGSLTSFASLLDRKQGITFSEAKFPFGWTAPKLELRDVRAVGGLGLTGDGTITIETGHDTCDVRGNVIPSYSLNTALGRVPVLNKIPILGSVLGADGKGIFGIAYRVEGALADPAVTVNPLKTVAPNMLRTWFLDPFTRERAPTRERPPPR